MNKVAHVDVETVGLRLQISSLRPKISDCGNFLNGRVRVGYNALATGGVDALAELFLEFVVGHLTWRSFLAPVHKPLHLVPIHALGLAVVHRLVVALDLLLLSGGPIRDLGSLMHLHIQVLS